MPALQHVLLSDVFGDGAVRLLQLVTWLTHTTPISAPLLGQGNIVFVTGPSGVGKSFLIHQALQLLGIGVTVVSLGMLTAQFPDNLHGGLAHYLNMMMLQPHVHVVLLDNIEELLSHENVDADMLQVFNSFIQRTHTGKSLLLVTSRHPNQVNAFVRRNFTDTITLDVPLPVQREAMTRYYLAPWMTTDVTAVSTRCHGFILCDIACMVQRAVQTAIEKAIEPECLTMDDFLVEVKGVPASALQLHSIRKPERVTFDAIGGLNQVKQKLDASVIWMFKHQEAYHRLGIPPTTGVLLYGPPGTGKTLLAKAVASEINANFIACSIPQLIKGEVGESEKAIARIFELAKSSSPCVIFIDEIDSMFGTRDIDGSMAQKMVSQLMMELDGLAESPGTLLLAATNNPWSIDSSILRPGRLDVHIYVSPPDLASRQSILSLYTKHVQVSDREALTDVSNKTAGFTGADLSNIVRQAVALAVSEQLSFTPDHQAIKQLILNPKHLSRALQITRPSVEFEEIKRFERWSP